MSKDLRINDRIRAREVRLIDDESGEQLGVLPLFDALRIARERNLDLVEVAPNAVPPVCKLLDYGRFKYDQTKKEREQRKHQKTVELKEVRLTPKTDDHDIAFKTKTIQRFLEEGDKVKVTVKFKGREMAHPQLGRQVLEQIASNLKGTAGMERIPLMEGRTMTMILQPAVAKDQPARRPEGAGPARPEGAGAPAGAPAPSAPVAPTPAAPVAPQPAAAAPAAPTASPSAPMAPAPADTAPAPSAPVGSAPAAPEPVPSAPAADAAPTPAARPARTSAAPARPKP